MVIEAKNTIAPTGIVVPTSSGYETVETNCPINQPPADISGVTNKTVREIVLSATVMLSVAFCWAMSTQFTKSALVFSREYFYPPYFLVWFNTNFMIACYPVYLLCNVCRSRLTDLHEEALLIYGHTDHVILSYLRRTSLFLFFWLAANYSYSQSLGHISASATASIMSSNSAMVCVLGWFILHDQFIPFRLISVAAAIGGVVVMSMDHEFAGSILGISLSILSAFTAALYKVLFKKVIGDATIGQVSLFMSGLGMLNLCLNTVPMLVLLLTHLEKFTWSAIPWLPLFGAAILSLLFNFLINFGIALLHPLVISVGMLFGIPISAAVDIIFRHMIATPHFMIGAILILISCAIIALPVQLFENCYCWCCTVGKRRLEEKEKQQQDGRTCSSSGTQKTTL